jgi:regulator of replication initiation timing
MQKEVDKLVRANAVLIAENDELKQKLSAHEQA